MAVMLVLAGVLSEVVALGLALISSVGKLSTGLRSEWKDFTLCDNVDN